jgi:outer membrane protein TolC
VARRLFDVRYSYLNVAFGGSPTPFQFPGIYPKTTVAFDARFDLFDGFKNFHQLDAADKEHQAARILSDWTLFQVQEQVHLKFYQALAAKMLSELADQNVKTMEDHLRVVHHELKNGQATKYDVLRVEVQLSEAQSDKIETDDLVALSRESLAQTMGLKSDNRELSGKLPMVNVDEVLKTISGMDWKSRPDLKAKELQAKAALDQSAAADAYWIPRVSLIGEYQFYNSPDYLATGLTDSSDLRTNYFVGAAASWDILDGGISLAKSHEASEKANGAQADLEEARLEAPYDFDLWKRKLVSGAAIYQAKLANVDKAKESSRLATLGFKAGTNTTTDVLDAELERFRAAAGVVKAQVDMLEAESHLELAIGKRLENE